MLHHENVTGNSFSYCKIEMKIVFIYVQSVTNQINGSLQDTYLKRETKDVRF